MPEIFGPMVETVLQEVIDREAASALRVFAIKVRVSEQGAVVQIASSEKSLPVKITFGCHDTSTV